MKNMHAQPDGKLQACTTDFNTAIDSIGFKFLPASGRLLLIVLQHGIEGVPQMKNFHASPETMPAKHGKSGNICLPEGKGEIRICNIRSTN